jgi:glycosyltransferase involved in cell wall biosynthesis
MPTYNSPEKWLKLAIDSVRNQLYPNWELCVPDDASSKPQVTEIVQEYQSRDPRIKVVYRKNNGHIAAASNSAIEIATGEFIALLDHDDELGERALYTVAVEVNAHRDADLIYSDEDKVDDKGCRCDPYFKPDWNPELFSMSEFCQPSRGLPSRQGKGDRRISRRV